MGASVRATLLLFVTAPRLALELLRIVVEHRDCLIRIRESILMKKHAPNPSVSYTFTIRLTYPNRIGTFARIVGVIGKHGGDLGAVDIVTPDAKVMTRDISIRARNSAHQ